MSKWLDCDLPIVRCMPNTPAMLQVGATGLFATSNVSNEQRDQAERILRAVGITLWVNEESDIDSVTAVSGSGPAYYFLMMEAMQAAAEKLGLPAETAKLLTLQTALGAARMALESQDDPATLRQKVTSPGGTTEQAILSFEENGLRDIFEQAMTAARDRSISLSEQLDKD
jgi:pyrroline-5-carboxylate reductase